jgi:hypothetical protein
MASIYLWHRYWLFYAVLQNWVMCDSASATTCYGNLIRPATIESNPDLRSEGGIQTSSVAQLGITVVGLAMDGYGMLLTANRTNIISVRVDGTAVELIGITQLHQLLIDGIDIPNSGLEQDAQFQLRGMTVSPFTGQLYTILHSTTLGDRLVMVNMHTGDAITAHVFLPSDTGTLAAVAASSPLMLSEAFDVAIGAETGNVFVTE